MARATVALTPQIQKRMDVLSKVFEGWEEDCMNCKAFAASLADWTTPKGAEVIREGEDAAQPQLLICESGAAEVFVTTTTKSGAKKQKRVARLVAPFYVGEVRRGSPTSHRSDCPCTVGPGHRPQRAHGDDQSRPGPRGVLAGPRVVRRATTDGLARDPPREAPDRDPRLRARPSVLRR